MTSPFSIVKPGSGHPEFHPLDTHAAPLVPGDSFVPSPVKRANLVADVLGHKEPAHKWNQCRLNPVGEHVKPGACYYKIPDVQGASEYFVLIPWAGPEQGSDRPKTNFGFPTLEAARLGFGPPAVNLPPHLGATCTVFIGEPAGEKSKPAVLTREIIRKPEVMARVLKRLAEKHNSSPTRHVRDTPEASAWPRAYAQDAFDNLAKANDADPAELSTLRQRVNALAARLHETADLEVIDNGDLHYENLVREGGGDAAQHAPLLFIDLHDSTFYDPMYALARLAYTSRFEPSDLEGMLKTYLSASTLPLTDFATQLERLRYFSAIMNVTYFAYHHRERHDSNRANVETMRRRLRADEPYIRSVLTRVNSPAHPPAYSAFNGG